MTEPNPVLVEVTRGAAVESRHRGAAAVVAADGARVASWGDVERPVYPRSAVKPLQALALFETGAAQRFAFDDREIAVACASHNSEPVHLEVVAALLERIGLGDDDLECGAQTPMDEVTAGRLIGAGAEPTALHNNCSGKHVALLAGAVHLGEPTAGYSHPDHPAQRRLKAILAGMGGVDLDHAPRGTDGCGIPVIAMPLRAIARAMARLADPRELAPERAAACRRVVGAMTGNPYLVAGRGRFDTAVMAAAGDALVVKTGAEGVHVAALPGAGIGIALKIDDGARRAAETAMAALLDHLGVVEGDLAKALAPYLYGPLTNAAGEAVGVIRPAAGWPGD